MFASEHKKIFAPNDRRSQELATMILSNVIDKMELPNTFGIFGDWGTGKTTIIRAIEGRIAEEKQRSDHAVLYFDAWRYEYSKSVDLLYALLHEIRKMFGISVNDNWRELSNFVLAASSEVATQVIDKLTFGIINPTTIAEKTIQLSDEETDEYRKGYEAYVDRFKTINGLFDSLIRDGMMKKKKKKLIIFIDDLDRCLPESTVRMLEAIKLFLTQESTLFVLAIDNRVVSEMVEKKYGLHQGFGGEYLEKIISYNLILPKPELHEIVNEILSRHGLVIADRPLALILGFLRQFCPEPRRAKRIIHQFAMGKFLSRSPEHYDDVRRVQTIFLATFLSYKWPKIFGGKKGNIDQVLRAFRSLQRSPLNAQERKQTIEDRLSWIDAHEVEQLDEILKYEWEVESGHMRTGASLDISSIISQDS